MSKCHVSHGYAMSAAIIAAASLLASCNDEVFINPLPEPETVELNPSGDSRVIDLRTDGAQFLSLYIPDEFQGTCWVLDASGDTLGTTYIGAKLPGGLIFDSPTMSLKTMATESGRVSIDLGHCYSLTDTEVNLYIHYPMGQVTIPVYIKAIEPFEPVAIRYRSNFLVNPDRKIDEKESIVVENMSTDTLAAYFKPYYGANAFVSFDDVPNLPVSTLSSSELEVPTPGADGPGLYGFRAPFIPGERQQVTATGVPDLKVRVKVPPMSRRRYTIFLEYEVISAWYTVTLHSPSIDRDIRVDGLVKTEYPVDYIIGYNDLTPASKQ